MPPKRLKQLMSGEVVSAEPVSTYKATPKPYIEDQRITKYRLERDRYFYKLFLKTDDIDGINFLKEKYGF